MGGRISAHYQETRGAEVTGCQSGCTLVAWSVTSESSMLALTRQGLVMSMWY